MKNFIAGIFLWLLAFGFLACSQFNETTVNILGDDWVGNAISYSGYRQGQTPVTKTYPSKEQVLEDLKILEKNWVLLRLYGSDQHSEDVLETIRENNLKMKVMLGAWLGKEPGSESQNAGQVEKLIALANKYKGIVVAVNVGNEILVNWSFQPVPEEKVIAYVQRVKKAVSVPVTVADNYIYWRDHGGKLAEAVDFVTMHCYPLWERKGIDEGMSFTLQNYEEVKKALPNKNIVIGEAGWATFTEGNLHIPRAGSEVYQKRYFEELTTWSKKNRVTVFFFEAFDESWKGAGTEGHWGLFSENRKAKLGMHEKYPELISKEPTSPDYNDAVHQEKRPLTLTTVLREHFSELGEGTVNVLGGWPDVAAVEESNDALSGASSLKFTYNGKDWGGVYFRLEKPADVSSFSSLIVHAKLPDEVKSLELKCEDTRNTSATVNVLDYSAGVGKNGWKQFGIPLKVFSKMDLKQLSILGFWHPKDGSGKFIACEILFDDLSME